MVRQQIQGMVFDTTQRQGRMVAYGLAELLFLTSERNMSRLAKAYLRLAVAHAKLYEARCEVLAAKQAESWRKRKKRLARAVPR